jgi:hypothetical protein
MTLGAVAKGIKYRQSTHIWVQDFRSRDIDDAIKAKQHFSVFAITARYLETKPKKSQSFFNIQFSYWCINLFLH